MQKSPARHFVESVATKAELEVRLASCSDVELAGLLYDWSFWARPSQLAPEGTWSSWTAVTGRGYGKTRMMSEAVQTFVQEGTARRILLISQSESQVLDVQIHGEAGLLATSPPWHKARYELEKVIWPCGSEAMIGSPERPDALFGPEWSLAWCSEIHGWSRATMQKAFNNVKMGLRLGRARMLVDTNPRRKHPILRHLIDRATASPQKHRLTRGTSYENADNLNAEALASWTEEYAGTAVGREFLEGVMLDESDNCLFKAEWLDRARRERPARLKRCVIAVDPAVSMRLGTDATGVIMAGEGDDGQIYCLQNMTARIPWEEWGDLVLDAYEQNQCDCLILERNRGGDAVISNVRARSSVRAKPLQIIKVGDDAPTRHVAGCVYVKEVIARSAKGTRAEPVASLVEKGRVSHVIGGNFAELEDQLTTWEDEPGAQSPNNLDAYVWAIIELANLSRQSKRTNSFAGVEKANRMLRGGYVPNASLESILRSSGGGRSL